MKKLLVAVALVVAGACALLIFTPFGIVLRQNPGSFHRGRFEAVVQQVRVVGIKQGEQRKLRLDDISKPESLRPLRPGESFRSGQGAGIVWAQMTKDGNLKVVIETRDLGHAGEYGFAYSDVPMSPRPFGGNWFTLDVPGHLYLVLPRMRIDDNWWKVLNNLD